MRARAQAIVETALVLPLVLLLAMGLFAVSEVALSESRLEASVAEAARAAATAGSASQARAAGVGRGLEVAAGQNLSDVTITVDVRDFHPGGRVRADGTMTVRLNGLLGFGSMQLHGVQVEPINPLRNIR